MANRPAELTRLFTEALNARDLDALLELVTEDAEYPTPQGRTLAGHDGLAAVVKAASDSDLLLARDGPEQVDGKRLTVPVRELVHRSEQHRTAHFEVRDGRVARFEVVADA